MQKKNAEGLIWLKLNSTQNNLTVKHVADTEHILTKPTLLSETEQVSPLWSFTSADSTHIPTVIWSSSRSQYVLKCALGRLLGPCQLPGAALAIGLATCLMNNKASADVGPDQTLPNCQAHICTLVSTRHLAEPQWRFVLWRDLYGVDNRPRYSRGWLGPAPTRLISETMINSSPATGQVTGTCSHRYIHTQI